MNYGVIYSSGEFPIEAGDEWEDVIEVKTTDIPANWLTLINEGSVSGFWRLVDSDGESTVPARLHRMCMLNIPCKNFSGKLQVRAGDRLGDRLADVFAFGGTST